MFSLRDAVRIFIVFGVSRRALRPVLELSFKVADAAGGHIVGGKLWFLWLARLALPCVSVVGHSQCIRMWGVSLEVRGRTPATWQTDCDRLCGSVHRSSLHFQVSDILCRQFCLCFRATGTYIPVVTANWTQFLSFHVGQLCD